MQGKPRHKKAGSQKNTRPTQGEFEITTFPQCSKMGKNSAKNRHFMKWAVKGKLLLFFSIHVMLQSACFLKLHIFHNFIALCCALFI